MKNYKRSFRFVCSDLEKPLVRDFLHAQGFTWEEEKFAHHSCRLIEEPFSLGLSLAAFFGYIYIQDRASMLPPVALNPPKGALVLDMCASPGSKTGQLANMVGETGFVIGNEPSPSRLATLRRNLQQMNLLNAVSCCYNGQSIPLPSNFFDYIQLDPPCSGWGTIERNPKVMDMWKEDKTHPLIRLQKELLQEAYRLLKPNGIMVYSTCTTNEEENEKQVIYAQELGFILEDLPSLPEFVMDDPLYNVGAVWRLSPRMGDTQGFFVARFRKGGGQTQDNHSYTQENVNQNYLYSTQEENTPSLWGNPLSKRHLQEIHIDGAKLSGDISIFGESVHFVHEKASLLTKEFAWQGMYMGKVSKHGDIALSPRVRLKGDLPSIHFTHEKGIAQIKGLLSGQSIALKDINPLDNENILVNIKNAKNALFYWNGLLLGRLKVKGSRLIWTER